MSRTLLAGLLMAAGTALGCVPEVPANPTYTNGVAAILDAHCVRCHGANDMLVSMPVAGRDHPPRTCYLQRYEDEGDCSSAATCKAGVGNAACAPVISTYINQPRDTSTAMPPLPSEALNDWEKEVVARWTKNGTPK